MRTLGYTLIWSPDKCVLKTAEGEELLLLEEGVRTYVRRRH